MDEPRGVDPEPSSPVASDAGAEPLEAGLSSSRPQRAARGAVAGLVLLFAAAVLAVAYLVRDQQVTTSHYVLLSMIVFATGSVGVLVRRNALVLFMSVELMLNAANLAFVAFARMHGRMEGQVLVLFVMIVAAAEVAVGLAIIVTIFRRKLTANVDDLSLLRW